MTPWQNAVQLLKDSMQQRDRIERLYVDYVPDKGTMSFSKERTGVIWQESEKVAETETDLGWHLSLTNRNQLIVVAHKATEFELTLRGKIGWENGVELMQEYGEKCYSNSRLEAKGICLTKERFEDLSAWLQLTAKSTYWLAERIQKLHGSCAEFLKMFYVSGDAVNGYYLYSSSGGMNSPCYAMRVGAYLSLDTLLLEDSYYNGSSPYRAIKMRVGDIREENSRKVVVGGWW